MVSIEVDVHFAFCETTPMTNAQINERTSEARTYPAHPLLCVSLLYTSTFPREKTRERRKSSIVSCVHTYHIPCTEHVTKGLGPAVSRTDGRMRDSVVVGGLAGPPTAGQPLTERCLLHRGRLPAPTETHAYTETKRANGS